MHHTLIHSLGKRIHHIDPKQSSLLDLKNIEMQNQNLKHTHEQKMQEVCPGGQKR